MHSVPFSFYALESRREQRRLALWAFYRSQQRFARRSCTKGHALRHPQKCIAEKRNAAKFTAIAGAAGVQKAREPWQQLARHTLLHPAALCHAWRQARATEECGPSAIRHQRALARHTGLWTESKCYSQIRCSIMHKVQKARELLRAISIANSSTLCCSALAVKLIQLTSDGFSNKNSCLVVTRLGAPMDKGVQSTKSVLASQFLSAA